jgi:hypothetical protein
MKSYVNHIVKNIYVEVLVLNDNGLKQGAGKWQNQNFRGQNFEITFESSTPSPQK